MVGINATDYLTSIGKPIHEHDRNILFNYYKGQISSFCCPNIFLGKDERHFLYLKGGLVLDVEGDYSEQEVINAFEDKFFRLRLEGEETGNLDLLNSLPEQYVEKGEFSYKPFSNLSKQIFQTTH